ncbi:MAG: DUF4340 domain-containing protein, partial [Alphaproteobacteria bacterium]|nr:DUF4340 domain-containing protein [Alphaproteobacteria bacterium]
MTAISQIREKLNVFRQQLSDLRYQAFKDIKAVADRVAIITIWLLPILFGAIFLIYKSVRLLLLPHRKNYVCFKPNKRLLYLSCGCLAMLSAGLISVYVAGYSSVDAYEQKLVFPNLAKNINKVNVLELQSNQGRLTFELVDGLWQLKENPSVPVYQERIRRLLTTISEARFFARKTDKAENLAMFNLLPLEDKNSKVIRINLKNAEEVLESFNLGDNNIDIGRGAKAAYIQLDNKFQVWEISADFVDMDLDWHKWTYSNLWDLRYGRIYAKYPNPEEESKLAEFMATMLNTPYIEVTEVPHKAAVKEIKLNVEDGNYVDISFYKDKNKAFAVYSFDKNNANIHLKLLAKYLGGKAVQIDIKQLEKLLEIIK